MSRCLFLTMASLRPILLLAIAALLPVSAAAAPSPDLAALERQALERRLASVHDPRAAHSPASEPVPSDGLWSGAFSLPQFDGSVNAFAEFRGELIAAGGFTQASGVPAFHVARWNGQRWASLGNGPTGLMPLALAVFDDRLYVSGYSDSDPSVGLLVRWDGNTWEDAKLNLTSVRARTLIVHQSELIAGGVFALAGIPSTSVIRLHAGAWESVGLMPDSYVQGLASLGTTLYAAGIFNSNYSARSPIVLRFNGSDWDTVAHATGSGGAPYVGDLAAFNGDLVVGGSFQEVEGVTAHGLARLHAGQWSELANTGVVTAIEPSASGLLIGGFFGNVSGYPTMSVARWNGSFWQTFGDGLYFGADAVIEYQGRVIAGGEFSQTGDHSRMIRGVASWDGVSWSSLFGTTPHGGGLLGYPQVTVGNPELSAPVRTLEVFDGSLYAGGTFLFENEEPYWPAHGVARWNGSGWEGVGSRAFNGSVHALAWYDNQVIAAGGLGILNIFRWDGESWKSLGTGTDAPIYALAVHGGDLYAAGSFGLAGGFLCSGIARWDGTRWWPVGPPQTPGGNPVFLALEEFQGDLIAAGSFDAIGDVEAHDVARWNGSTWSAVGSGPGATVQTLEVHDGVLWAGGDLTAAPEEGGSSVHTWDGSGWSTPAAQPDGRVLRLLSTRDGLFATGPFAQVGGTVTSGIARLSGSSPALGSGLGGSIPSGSAIAAYEGGLYVGGAFTLAGGKSAFHVARWDGLTLDPGSRTTLEPARPNPFARSTSVRFRLPPNSTGSVAVLDLGGRIVRTLRRGSFGAGPVDVTWDGRDDDGATQPAGIYFIRLRSNAGDRTARVAFVP